MVDAGDRETRYGSIRIAWSAKPAYMLAETLLLLGDYPGAKAAAEKALAAAESDGAHIQQGADRMLSLQGIGLASALMGQKAEALGAAAAMEKAADIGSAAKAAALGPTLRLGKARIFAACGEWAEAAAELSRPDASLDTWVSQAVDQDYLKLAIAYIRARAMLEAGKRADAAKAFAALLADPHAQDSGDILWPALLGAAKATDDADKSTSYLKNAADVIERQRKTISREASRIGYVGDKQEVYAALIAGLAAQGRAKEALEAAERSKSRALVDLLSGAKLSPRSGASAAPLEEIRRLDREAAGANPPSGIARGFARVKAAVAEADPGLAALVSAGSPGFEASLAKLEPGEALIEYWMGGGALWAFTASGGKFSAARLDASGLAETVEAFRAAIRDKDAGATAIGDKLGKLLIGSLGVSEGNLLIVPAGPLHYLPFAALRDGGSWLGERRRIRLAPSLAVLPLLSGGNASKPILVLGDPDLGDSRYDLPGAEGEARAVAAAYPDSRMLLRADATKAAFLAGSAYRIIHYAGHGQFLPGNPLGSRLLLAGPNFEGQLTAAELYNASLNADLVILSACETGLGKAANGDDVLGLERALFRAGTKAIISGLWQVDDEATGFLMRSLHVALLAGKRPTEALKDAQAAAMLRWPEPFFWAAFSMTGSD